MVTIEDEITNSIQSSKLRHINIPLPSWNLPSDNYRKRFPSKCPHLSIHLTLEFLVWIMIAVCMIMGEGNIGSIIVLLIFYTIIQCILQFIGCYYVDGIHRYKRILPIALYDEHERMRYLDATFNKQPLISFVMNMYETMLSINPAVIDKEISVKECATMIMMENNDGEIVGDMGLLNDTLYQNWFYCIEYEIEFDFIDDENGKRFKKLCIDFMNDNIDDDDYEFVAVECRIIEDMLEEYNKKYWNGYVMIINCKWKWSVYILRFIIQFLNVLCLSLLYKIPFHFVHRKRLKVVKYLGF